MVCHGRAYLCSQWHFWRKQTLFSRAQRIEIGTNPKRSTYNTISHANPYRAIKQALIKSYKLNENDRLDILFNRSQLGDRKPNELLNNMRQLLDAYDAHNPQTNVRCS